MKGPVQSVEVTYLVHSTEDGGRIGSAVARLLAIADPPATERLEGHFGNEILRARVRLTGDEAAGAAVRIFSAIPQAARKELESELEALVDEHGALFLRLDKQALVSGEVSLGSADSVRVKVKPRLFLVKGSAAGFYRDLLGGRADG